MLQGYTNVENNNATRIETSRVHFYRLYILMTRNTDGGKRTANRRAAGANIKGNRSVRIITDRAYLPVDIINSRSPRVTVIYDGRSWSANVTNCILTDVTYDAKWNLQLAPSNIVLTWHRFFARHQCTSGISLLLIDGIITSLFKQIA